MKDRQIYFLVGNAFIISALSADNVPGVAINCVMGCYWLACSAVKKFVDSQQEEK